ncbi:MAG: hypothetical protein II557_05140 [Clostridia bacterium]|nr:hypothetical protein [Clostridia bacterium]
MKRRFTRIVAAFLALLLLLPACGKEKKQTEPGINEETEIVDPNILTHIYQETARSAVLTDSLTSGFVPFYDRETKTLTYLTEEYEAGAGGYTEKILYSVRTLSEEGGENVVMTLAFPMNDGMIRGGFADREGMTCAVIRYDENRNRRMVIERYDFKSGQRTATDDILSLFAGRTIAFKGPVRDGSGNLCVVSEADAETLVLTPEGNRIRSFFPDVQGRQISWLVASEDGRIFASFSGNRGETVVAEILTEEGKWGETQTVESRIWGGTDGIPYYYETSEGLYARLPDSEADRMLLDYENSGLTPIKTQPLYLSPEAAFFCEYANVDRSGGSAILCCVPGEDIDLREQTILTLAHFGSVPTSLTDAIRSFHLAHPGVRIVTEDWSEFNTKENPEGGYQKLLTDMVTGKGSPDILFGRLTAEHIAGAYEHGLYTDLTPYLRIDDTVNESNLFGCVKRLFDDGRGGMWGITPDFSIDATLISTPELLGGFAEQGYWTITEVLDYIDSLPDDTMFNEDLCRDDLPLLDAGDGYMIFIDRERGTCSFDSPEFIRYLEFVKTLPTSDERNVRSPFADMDAEALALPRMEGKIRTTEARFLTSADKIRRLMMPYSTKDWTMIGYPAPVKRAGAGTPVTTQYTLVISSSCPDPDLAWDLVRRCFSSEGSQGGIPALKSTFDCMIDAWYQWQFDDYYVLHDFVYSYRDREYAITEEDLEYPGILSTFEREDRDKYVALFDEIGTAASERGIKEIRNILTEETSAYLAGLGSAEDCAAKIQSRVSIWLAEHK